MNRLYGAAHDGLCQLSWQTGRRPATARTAPGRGHGRTATLPTKATHQRTRAFNQQLVLRAIYDHSPISRAELARLTGLTRTSVSELVGDVLADGLVEEIGRGPSSGGKAPILVQFAPSGRHIIGLDLGEATFSGAVVDLRGQIVRTLHLPLEGRDGDAALQLVFELTEVLRAGAARRLLGIGITRELPALVPACRLGSQSRVGGRRTAAREFRCQQSTTPGGDRGPNAPRPARLVQFPPAVRPALKEEARQCM